MKKNQAPSLLTNAFRSMLLIGVLVLSSLTASASHYRYGNITWTNTSARNITFHVALAFRRTFFNPLPSSPGTVNTGYTFNFGDGSGTTIILNVTSINATEDWFYGEATINHTYNADGVYTASYLSSARLGTLINNANGNFGSFSTVTIGGTHTGNNSPVSSMQPIVNMIAGSATGSFQLVASDPDNNPITYRFATSLEMGGPAANSLTQPLGMSAPGSTGVVVFNTVGKTVGQLYNAAFVVQDSHGATTMIDVLVRIVAASSPPVFDYAITPNNTTIYNIQPGNNVSFTVKATDIDPGDIVTLNAIGLPTGAVLTPNLPTSGNPASTTFSWTPTTAQLGSRVITFIAQDIANTQTTTTVTVVTSMNPVFDVPPTPALNSSDCIAPGVLHQATIQAHAPDPAGTLSLNTTTPLSGVTYAQSLPTTAANVSQTTMSWTPTVAQWGPHTFSYVATDNLNHSTTHSFDRIVNSLPSFTSSPGSSPSVIAGQSYTYNIVATDPDLGFGDDLEIVGITYPAWLAFTDNGNGTATLTGTPSVADAGPNPIRLDVEDVYHHCHNVVSQAFNIQVIPCNVSITHAATDVQCKGGSNGAIDITVHDATTPVSYSWSNSATTEDINGITAGSYTISLIDANGCTATDAIIVGQPEVALSAISTAIPAICYGYTNGSITVIADGGTHGYTYTLGASTNNTGIFSGLAAGSYTVTVSDAHNCTTTASTIVNQPNPIMITHTVSDVLCNGGSNGAIDITVHDAIAPVNYSWNNSTTTEDLNGVSSGSYTVLLVDANGCTASDGATVGQPTVALSSTAISSPATCNAYVNGSLTATAAGGTSGYTYTLGSNTNNTGVFTALAAGSYTVTITDAHSCTTTASAIVGQPNPLTVGAITASPMYLGDNCNMYTIYLGYGSQSITLSSGTVAGGTPSYTYAWTPAIPLSTSASASTVVSPSSSTNYHLTVTDAHGCQASRTFGVAVKDVRCGNNKVNVYHNTGNGGHNVLCVSVNAVPAHLGQHGDCLGDGAAPTSPGAKATASAGHLNLETGGIAVFPNPASGNINIQLKDMGSAYQSYHITDLNGRIVATHQFIGDIHADLITIDISSYAKGIYIIRAVTGDGTSLTKFTVQ